MTYDDDAYAQVLRLHSTTDAAVWAEEFKRNFPDRTPDGGTMIGWFANAIEIGRAAGTAANREADTGVTVRVAPGVTLHGDTGAFTATADAPPAAIARLLRQLADDLDRQAAR